MKNAQQDAERADKQEGRGHRGKSGCRSGIHRTIRFAPSGNGHFAQLLSQILAVFRSLAHNLARISPAVNTIRIFSIIDRLGVPHIALPYLRAGIGKSVTDNICAGGIFYIVDPDTGIVHMTGRTLREQKRYIIHPNSDVIVPGFKVPYYEEICGIIKRAALVTPSLRYVGWDVAITPNGPAIIEGNIEYAQTYQGIDGLYREAKKYL